MRRLCKCRFLRPGQRSGEGCRGSNEFFVQGNRSFRKPQLFVLSKVPPGRDQWREPGRWETNIQSKQPDQNEFCIGA